MLEQFLKTLKFNSTEAFWNIVIDWTGDKIFIASTDYDMHQTEEGTNLTMWRFHL